MLYMYCRLPDDISKREFGGEMSPEVEVIDGRMVV
jgi:hypothetical protein